MLMLLCYYIVDHCYALCQGMLQDMLQAMLIKDEGVELVKLRYACDSCDVKYACYAWVQGMFVMMHILIGVD